MRTGLIAGAALALGLLARPALARDADAQKYLSCALGADRSHPAEILRAHPLAGTHRYYLRQSGARVPVFGADAEESRGGAVSAQCAGHAERVLLLSGEFSSNYIKGFALRYNTRAGAWERIDFAERARPSRVYLDDREMLLVIPNAGHEGGKKYIVYRTLSDEGQAPASEATDSLPAAAKRRVIRLTGK